MTSLTKLLLNRYILWALFYSNLGGTIYGYMWYGNQLEYTAATMWDGWLPFVPDSPTASLLFTLSIGFLLVPSGWWHRRSSLIVQLRSLIDALAVVTSFKYGIWAVTMILWGASLGDVLSWQHYMLIGSHLAMALEALLYGRLVMISSVTIGLAVSWLLLNDFADYTLLIYPWLPPQLDAIIGTVSIFTLGLSVISYFIGMALVRLHRTHN